jgi:hypothetical protein
MVDREMDRQPAPFTRRRQHRPLETSRVEHGDEVCGEDFLGNGVARVTFRCAPTSVVEPNGTAEAGHSFA